MRISALKLMTIASSETSDAEILHRFIARREEAAFEELVRRHGPGVLRVCRRLVGPNHAADAFQAVFLVLACRAKHVRKASSVGSWLIGVAGRVARQMRQRLKRRQLTNLEHLDEIGLTTENSNDSHLVIPELAAALDEELRRLPDSLRAPVVLCLVEGRTQEQAVAELGGSIRTLRRRLERAKSLLRLRLERRGVVPVVIAALLGSLQSSSAVPPELVRLTVHGVFEFLAGGGIRSAPAAIAKGVISNMATFKAVVFLPVAALVLVGLGVVLAQDRPGQNQFDPLVQPPVEVEKGKGPRIAEDVFSANLDVIKPNEESHRSTNFIVYAPTPTMARAIAAEAEYQREELAKVWLGRELPALEKPCEVRFTPAGTRVGTGLCVFSYRKAEDGSHSLATSRIELNGDFIKVLTDAVPIQVMHVVLHSHFGRQIPRWADEGLTMMVKPVEEQGLEDVRCRQLLNAGRGIRLSILFQMKAYPKDMIALQAEGYSVARFLIGQKVSVGAPYLKDLSHIGRLFKTVSNGRQQFICFLHLGMEKDSMESWNTAAKSVYGYETVEALEDAWLKYLRKPESMIKPPGFGVVSAGFPVNPELIPPTTLPGTGGAPAPK